MLKCHTKHKIDKTDVQWNPSKVTTSGTSLNWSTKMGGQLRGVPFTIKLTGKKLVWDWQNMVTFEGWPTLRGVHFEGFHYILDYLFLYMIL